jgi:exportin-T
MHLFHSFVKENKHDLPLELVPNFIDSMQDLLLTQVTLPDMDNPTQQELLAEAAANPGVVDSQLSLYETVGILRYLTFKTPERQAAMLQSVVKPLLDDLSIGLQVARKGAPDVITILQVRYAILALANVAKGFPEYPSPVPEGYLPPPIEVFARVTQVCLEAMSVFQVVRDAVGVLSSSWVNGKSDTLPIDSLSRISAVTAPSVTRFIPPPKANHFELANWST